MASLMCGKLQERDVGLKEEENWFIDAFFFFLARVSFQFALCPVGLCPVSHAQTV